MIIAFYVTLLFLPISAPAINSVAEGYKIDDGAVVDIDAHSTCKSVTNNSGVSQFVATKTSAEWSSFLTHLPSGISAADCAPANPCGDLPDPGGACTGGAIYLGSLSPGAISGRGTDHYMTTPGGCTDSPTPTCSGTDSLTKSWMGAGGTYTDITDLVNYSTTTGTGKGANNKDQNYGDFNTAAILADTNIGSNSAAAYCDNLTYGGYSDWYLPNRYELNLLYENRNNIPGLNTADPYWSSTEYNSTKAWKQNFSNGNQDNYTTKLGANLVRCVRKFKGCGDSLSPGSTCTGGTIYLGSLNPGALDGTGTDRYMTTPGGCTDSSTPTCSGTDSLTKSWRGASSAVADIAGLVNYTTASGIGNGSVNTDQHYGDDNAAVIMADSSIGANSAAHYCEALTYGGYGDWYLPNRYELNLMFTNKGVIPGLETSGTYYWSSTEATDTTAWAQTFSNGNQPYHHKASNYRVRCVRRD